MSTFVDTSAFVTIMDADDPNHKSAKNAWATLIDTGEALVTSNYVVVETAALVQRRLGLSAVRCFQHDMLPVVSVDWVDEPSHAAAMVAVLAGGRRGPSLVDCVSFGIIDKLSIPQVFAYDRHFADRGFEFVGRGGR